MLDRLMQRTNSRIDHSELTTLSLSNDIGKMADRIGVMADRIGEMAERLLETQELQSKNMETLQKSMLEMMQAMTKQMEFNNKMMEFMLSDGVNITGQLPNGKLWLAESAQKIGK